MENPLGQMYGETCKDEIRYVFHPCSPQSLNNCACNCCANTYLLCNDIDPDCVQLEQEKLRFWVNDCIT